MDSRIPRTLFGPIHVGLLYAAIGLDLVTVLYHLFVPSILG